jgi:hypothetical protein
MSGGRGGSATVGRGATWSDAAVSDGMYFGLSAAHPIGAKSIDFSTFCGLYNRNSMVYMVFF